MNNIISLVPYRILPATSGGQVSIADLHHYMGMHCHDHIIGTTDNVDEHGYSFKIHRVFPVSKLRYSPRYRIQQVERIAHEVNARYVFCEHPYMAPSAMELSRRLGVPWFIRSQNIESERFRTLGKPWWRVMRAFESYCMQRADGVFFITQEDMIWGMQQYKLNPFRCHVAPFGTALSTHPSGREAAKQIMAAEHGLDAGVPWLYFLGALDYQPNTEAVQYILDEVVPRLQAAGMQYELLVAGKGLKPELQQRIAAIPNLHYMGFIPVLDTFLKACDVMLNPVMTGGGIKTKAVEALAYNKMVVSSATAAAGLMPEACGDNLQIVADHDWDTFAATVQEAATQQHSIPNKFYDTYYWDNIATKVLSIMKRTTAEFR